VSSTAGLLSLPVRMVGCMTRIDPMELMKGFRAVDLDGASPQALIDLLNDIRRVRSQFDLLEAEAFRLLSEVSPTPEHDVASAARRPARHGKAVRRRAETLAAIPALADALRSGNLDGNHVDVYANVVRSQDGPVREELAARAERLVARAVLDQVTPEEFADRLQATADEIAADGGVSRFERQQRATRVRTWTNRSTGMWHIAGRFDPKSGAEIHARIQGTVAALFASKVSATAPDDAVEKQDHLRALAVRSLICDPHQGNRSGRPEFIVVVDGRDVDSSGRPSVDLGLPVTIPWDQVAAMAARSKVHPIVIHHKHVVAAQGNLDLGRSSRLANDAQRRALRALYSTCAMPGCDAHVQNTRPHHVWPWEHGGPTDLWNLCPLCSSCHSKVHRLGWHLLLGPNRELTVYLPDGTEMSTGPPSRKSAA
jgi:hypothetical protein